MFPIRLPAGLTRRAMASTTCPNTDVQQGTYTSTPTLLVVEVPAGTSHAGARTLVETFTKQ
jgi:hypothetical protein